jgi:hypothetical protein
MQDMLRAAIALLVKGEVLGKLPAAIQDEAAQQKRSFRGVKDDQGIHVIHDEEPKLHLFGNLPELYELESQTRIHLSIGSGDFHGVDRTRTERFGGRVTAGRVEFYDFGERRNYTYA